MGRIFGFSGSILDAGRRYDMVAIIWRTLNLGWAVMREWPVRLALYFGVLLIAAFWLGASLAEKLVDPNAVAPEFRDVAEKRRAEQLRLVECTRKADEAKIVRRDRAAFVGQCLDK